ncbi:hypothetical protein K1T71_005820 [Dendrolimus kikuchii]|uniref:Uncharacterized protein n=1 Tax=Dendrolimus kikuchii TaxID=765133 RepID=A0ACC1D5H3_9NEOP|nr:hypothetical protein K1T71_005820 [Dendrolimus kikuchii]
MSSRKRSVVWNHFNFTEVEPNKAKCSYCSNYIAISGGNVGNLSKHLKSKHPTVLFIPPRQPNLTTVTVTDENHKEIASHAADINAVSVLCPTPAQQAIAEFVQNMRPIGPRRTERVDEQLLKMIAKGHHPFSIVDEPEFKKLLTLLCPGYSLPTGKTIAENHLLKLYRSGLEKAKLKVAAAPATNEHFIAITAHYVEEQENKNLVLQSTMLGCVQYPDRTTATNLAEHMRSVMREWDIENKVTAIASDNSSNITAAVRSGDWRHIPCFVHTINLCVQSALEIVFFLRSCTDKNVCVTKCVKNVVEYFKRSSHALAKLKEIQGQLNVPQLKLKQDVMTRWNSTYDMFRRVLLVKDAVTATLALTKSDIMLSSNDWATIEAAVPILKIFYDVTVEISAEKNVMCRTIVKQKLYGNYLDCQP